MVMSVPHVSREQRRQLERERAKWPAAMTEVPRDQWPDSLTVRHGAPLLVWRSRDFLAQLFEDGITLRLSVLRTSVAADGSWRQDISWDDLQRVKCECGFADHWMLEFFPPAADVVCVANIRHLWLALEPPPFGWRKERPNG